MDIKYGLDKNFSAAQLEKLFLSVNGVRATIPSDLKRRSAITTA